MKAKSKSTRVSKKKNSSVEQSNFVFLEDDSSMKVKVELAQLTAEEILLVEQRSKLVALVGDLVGKVRGAVEVSKGVVDSLNLEIADLKSQHEVVMQGNLAVLDELSSEEGLLGDQCSKLVAVGDELVGKVRGAVEVSNGVLDGLKLEVSQVKQQSDDRKQVLYSMLVQLGMEELELSKERMRLKDVLQGMKLRVEKEVADVSCMVAALKHEIPAIKQMNEVARGSSLLTLRRLKEEEYALFNEKISLIEVEKKLRFKVEKEIEDRKCRIIALKMEIPQMKQGSNVDEDLFSVLRRLGEEESALLNEKSRLKPTQKPRTPIINEIEQKRYKPK